MLAVVRRVSTTPSNPPKIHVLRHNIVPTCELETRSLQNSRLVPRAMLLGKRSLLTNDGLIIAYTDI